MKRFTENQKTMLIKMYQSIFYYGFSLAGFMRYYNITEKKANWVILNGYNLTQEDK